METISFVVKGPIPRTAPYKKFRYHLYVPADVRKWRAKIAKAFLKAGGREPRDGEKVRVGYLYSFIKNHCDIDSITHSAQDALSKDALHREDKHWGLYADERAHVERNSKESVQITVSYTEAA